MRRKVRRSKWRHVIAAGAASSVLSLNFTGLFLLQANPFAVPPFVPPPPPREYLAQKCQEQGCDFALLDSIVFCESTWRMVPNARSSAYGYFQIIDGTEKTTPQYKAGERKFDPYTNIDMGLYLYESRGTNPWNESRHCWQKKYRQALSSANE